MYDGIEKLGNVIPFSALVYEYILKAESEKPKTSKKTNNLFHDENN